MTQEGGKQMNKADMVDAMAKAGTIKKAQAERALSGLMEAVKTSLGKGERVTLPGIGSLSCTQRKERTGRNPRTGQEIKIPATTSVKFSLAEAIKSILNPLKKRAMKKN
jgi:DNA-binding protein HU-beta